MDRRTPQDIANELYARGFTATRAEALTLVADAPEGVALLLGMPRVDREMRHGEDRAHPDEWGHANTGT